MLLLYQKPHIPFHRSHKKLYFFGQIIPLDHGGPEMKCTYFNHNCWKFQFSNGKWFSQPK